MHQTKHITESSKGRKCSQQKSPCEQEHQQKYLQKNVFSLSNAAGGLWNSTSSSNFSLCLEMKLLKSLLLWCLLVRYVWIRAALISAKNLLSNFSVYCHWSPRALFIFMSLHISIMPYLIDSKAIHKTCIKLQTGKKSNTLPVRGSMEIDWKGQKEFTAASFQVLRGKLSTEPDRGPWTLSTPRLPGEWSPRKAQSELTLGDENGEVSSSGGTFQRRGNTNVWSKRLVFPETHHLLKDLKLSLWPPRA